MRRALLAMVLVTTLSAAFAQPAGTGVVSGVVIESSSGDAVRKAVVTLTWQGTPKAWARARTDGSGRFRFEGLPAGKYDLRAVKTGIGTAGYGANSSRELGEFLELADGQTRDGITLRFIHSGSVAGRVLDADGEPMVHEQVMLQRPVRSLGERILGNYRSAGTNDRGEYRITNVDPGQYYAVVTVMPRSPAGSYQFALRQFYGGARELKNAAPLTVRGGESLTGIDFHVAAEALVRVRGRLTGLPDRVEPEQPGPPGNGKPRIGRGMGGGNLTIMSAEPGPFGRQGIGVSGPDRQFEIGAIPEGRYRLEAEDHVDGRLYSVSQAVDIRQGMGDIILNLMPATDLKGQLRVEGPGGPPASSFNVFMGLGNPPRRNASAHVGADGRFTIPSLSEGEWGMNVTQLPRGAFLKSAMLGDKDVRFTPFEVGPKTDATLNIVISMNSGRIEGEVDAAGADSTRAGILLAPFGAFHNLTRFYRATPSDGNGKFKLEGIAPGKYKVFALEKMAAASFLSPEAADQLDALGTEIEVGERATVQVRPKLIPMDRARQALQ
ncbi:MAG TPA: carboxypeptidase-like regulatory domain-containing protein [Bryobacteraceae bacterium]|nr:carboxypeptidase-like regulatory domain-containing protein [Bryobacteraceae bacterium]